MVVYDKVCWHWPEGTAPDLESAMTSFIAIMSWLEANQLLNKDGVQEFESRLLDADFVLADDLLIPLGKKILDKYYDEWRRHFDYGDIPGMEILDFALRKEHNSGKRNR